MLSLIDVQLPINFFSVLIIFISSIFFNIPDYDEDSAKIKRNLELKE
jgi:hypothetical protein